MHSKVHEIAYKDNGISWGAPSRTLASALKDSTLKAIDISRDLLDAPTALAACCGFDLCHKYILYLYLYLYFRFVAPLSKTCAPTTISCLQTR